VVDVACRLHEQGLALLKMQGPCGGQVGVFDLVSSGGSAISLELVV